MKYISDLDLDELVNDFKEDYELTTDMEIDLRLVAKAVNRTLVEYANSNISDDPKHDFEVAVLYLNGKFYADADFGDLPVLLPCRSVYDAASELGILDEKGKWQEEIYDKVDWVYYWLVRRILK